MVCRSIESQGARKREIKREEDLKDRGERSE